jgi:predicted phosphate transport protein (TIGR00153 family)
MGMTGHFSMIKKYLFFKKIHTITPMAKTSYFSRIFGNSPVSPLQKHIASVIACVEQLIPYFEAVFAGDWDEATKIQRTLASLEGEADDTKNQLRMDLPTSLFMPVDRRDILELLDMQDLIANRAKDISGLTLGRKMSIPGVLADDFMAFLHRCIDATKQAQIAINELDELVVTGFRGDEATRVREMVAELHVIENETDDIQVKLRASLYALESELPPIDVMFIYKIIEWIGDLADASQSTGNRLQLMLAK